MLFRSDSFRIEAHAEFLYGEDKVTPFVPSPAGLLRDCLLYTSVRSIDVVNELGFTKASVSIAMKKLRENGYIAVDGEGNLTLLAPGREIAERIYSRHRLLTHFFMQLGVDEKTAAEDACKAEHILSEQTLEKIRERAIETDAELGKTVK